MQILLGSQSPRRKEILSNFISNFSVASSGYDESNVKFEGCPKTYVKRLAENKRNALAFSHEGKVIITADTIVYFKNQVFPKPKDELEAAAFLKTLSGQTHSVFTAVCVSKNKCVHCSLEETKVTFFPFTEKEIQSYVRLIDPLDKAGGYAIQGRGALIVSSIEGCFFNVMGLPVALLRSLLKQFQIDLLNM